MPKLTTDSKDPRIIRVRQSDTIYYWSIKNQKLYKLLANKFGEAFKCNLCIPIYYNPSTSRYCGLSFSSFNAFKEHILKRELSFSRPLAWVSKSEIPINLKRDRELGDLKSLEKENFLKIQFNSKTFVDEKSKIIAYLKENGCPCQDGEKQNSLKCNVKTVNWNSMCLFAHLSHLERFNKRYYVFKADLNSSILSINNLPSFRSNNNSFAAGFDGQTSKVNNLTNSNKASTLTKAIDEQTLNSPSESDRVFSNNSTHKLTKNNNNNNVFIIDGITIEELPITKEMKIKFDQEFEILRRRKIVWVVSDDENENLKKFEENDDCIVLN